MAWLIDSGGSRRLLSDGRYLVGRDPNCGIVINAPDVSRHHAELIVSGAKLTVRDLDSQNGTFISGQRLSSHSPVQLTGGTEVVFGTTSVALAPQVEQPVQQPELQPRATQSIRGTVESYVGEGRPMPTYYQRPRGITAMLTDYFPGATAEQVWSLMITLIGLPIIGTFGALLSSGIWATFWISAFGGLPWATGLLLSGLYYVTGTEGVRNLGRTGLIVAWFVFAIAQLIVIRRIDVGIGGFLH